MSVIGMPLLSHGQVRTLRKRHHANSFLWAHVPKEKIASTILLTTKIRNTIMPQCSRVGEPEAYYDEEESAVPAEESQDADVAAAAKAKGKGRRKGKGKGKGGKGKGKKGKGY